MKQETRGYEAAKQNIMQVEAVAIQWTLKEKHTDGFSEYMPSFTSWTHLRLET